MRQIASSIKENPIISLLTAIAGTATAMFITQGYATVSYVDKKHQEVIKIIDNQANNNREDFKTVHEKLDKIYMIILKSRK